ncbi:hypothetical protein EMIT0P43_40035 [Pseudomonas jessenii]
MPECYFRRSLRGDLVGGDAQPLASHKPYVGAGLLAKAVCQSTSLLNDTPYSRASPLPHFGLRCSWGS